MKDTDLSTWVLDSNTKLRRDAPRPIEMRQGGYEQVFDYNTILYDLFRDASGQKIIAIGPALHNLFLYSNK
ncbi:hypothetical protein GCM10028812_52790 [Ancylobacter sonchi]